MRTRGTRLLIFFSLYSRRSFLLISLAFENPLSITLSLYPRFFKWWRKSPSHLKKRGYNDKVIESGFSKASEINRNNLLEYKGKKINKRVPLVLTLAKLFPEPLVVAFRRPKSIKDTLVRAAVSRPSSTVGQCKPCCDKRCKCYLQLQHTQVFHSKTTGKEYKIFCNVNCKTPNVVYLLDCHVCGSQYVGESVQPFNKRMNGHRSDLTKKTLIGRLWQIQNLYHWPQSKLESKSRTEKREFLDPRVTNITPGRHTQKGLNLLFF